MSSADHRPFSFKWTAASIVIFMITEAVLGWWLGSWIFGSSLPGQFRGQAVLHIGSYFVGGLIVGVVSPGVRIHEPAIGAFLAAAGSLLLAVFVPLSFFRVTTWQLLLAGALACALALWGARLGERMTGTIAADGPGP